MLVVDIPPNKLANPPIFKAPPSDSEPTVREVTYAAPVLMLVVDIPPVGLNAPVKVKLFIYAFCVLMLVVDIPPPRVAKPIVLIELVLIVYVLNEVVTISPIFIYPNVVPIVNEVTVKEEINAICVLIDVVDIPPARVAKPPIFKAPPSDSDPTVRDVT